jgi:ADP-ribose pyrophosphatase YjhB (NUDIX family)
VADRRSLLMTTANGVRRVWWKLRRPLAVGAAGLVVDRDGRVLLVRQSYATRRWTLPGGGVKKGETLADCARRELREEVGVVAGPEAVELLGLYANFKQGKSDHIAVYVIREWEREAVNDIEISNAEFFSPDELPDPMSGAVRRRIEEYLGRRPVDTRW